MLYNAAFNLSVICDFSANEVHIEVVAAFERVRLFLCDVAHESADFSRYDVDAIMKL
jgi:hypothetical protein